MRLARRSLLAALAAAALSACERVPTITPVEDDPAPVEVHGLEERFGVIAGAVPGFGGYFYDADGALTAYVTDPASEAEVRAILSVHAERRPSNRERRTAEIRVLPGRYPFARLAEWRDALASLLPLPGVVFVDADEAVNRVRIGVVRDEVRPAVRDAAFRLGIPPEALVISAERSLQRLTGVPGAGGARVPGGHRLAFESARSTIVQCSLGFNVLDVDGGYVTASHCSRVQGQVDGTVHHQPGDGQALGSEVSDPPLFQRGACPETRRCRYSDAALFRLAPGRVAESTLAGPDANATMRVIGERAYPVAGEVLDKVGAETGWTFGVVAATCVHVNVDGTDVTLLCQDVVDAPARGGDSGAPVFSSRGGQADLAGILWGGTGARFYFSCMANLRAELGPFATR